MDLLKELPMMGISQREADRWTEERLKELEGIVTTGFWNLTSKPDQNPVLWERIGKLKERYNTPSEKRFIFKIRRFIQNSLRTTA